MQRYRIKRVRFTTEEYDAIARPYGLWDTVAKCYVNKWGEPCEEYWAVSREIAEMRRRDLNEYAKAGA